jgi:quercetin dioxygenase-like cupin family protein
VPAVLLKPDLLPIAEQPGNEAQRKEPSPMKITRLADVPKNRVEMEGAAGAWKQLVLGAADGVPHFSFRVFTLDPGGHTPHHRHDAEHLNYIISGHGMLRGPDGTEQPIQAGDFAFVAPGERHQYCNASADSALVMICAVPRDDE